MEDFFYTKTQKIIMAVLFALPGAIEAGELSKASGVSIADVIDELKKMGDLLKKDSAPILIKEINGKYQLCSNPLYYENLIRVVASPKKPVLTDVIMETLAIVAEKKQVTRVEIEKIRGVKSDFAVNKLVEYGLIEEKGRMNVPGRPIIFGPTDEFYRRFGVDQDNPIPEVGTDIKKEMTLEAEEEVSAVSAD